MANYKFIKDYKNDDKYRQSFCRLAKKTFGIDFEAWYQQGFWDESYICYSYLKDDEVVSNVSLNRMALIIEGEKQKAIQIGTVMTDPEHRRRGLAYKLLSKVLEDYDSEYDLYYLAADQKAVPLYTKCGFSYRAENKYIIDLEGYSLRGKPLEAIEVEPAALLEIKKTAGPLSKVLSAVGDQHVLMFYYFHGFKDMIYKPMEEVYAIFNIEGDILKLYDILSPVEVNLSQLIEATAPIGVKQVVCYFTPQQQIKGLQSTVDSDSNWMLRNRGVKGFPAGARYPRISQT